MNTIYCFINAIFRGGAALAVRDDGLLVAVVHGLPFGMLEEAFGPGSKIFAAYAYSTPPPKPFRIVFVEPSEVATHEGLQAAMQLCVPQPESPAARAQRDIVASHFLSSVAPGGSA